MNENNYLKILSIIGFLVFAAISCWATSASLHLLLPTWPYVFCWAITIGFFIIASLGTKMIVDSLNQNIYMERRGTTLLGGIFLVLIFWLLFTMPTNTHTFFYRNLIDDWVTNEIATTQGYLAQIKDGTVTKKMINDRVTNFKNQVEVKMGELENEIKNEERPGFGPKAKEILGQFATMLDVVKVEPLSYSGTSQQDRQRLCNAYRAKIFTLRDIKIRNMINEMTPTNNNYRKVADRDWKNLDLVKQNIDKKNLSLTDADDMKTICDKINQGYSTIKMYNQFVEFKNNSDRTVYTADNPQTNVARLLSVYDVWIDFLAGKLGGLVFVFWIFISVLIDSAAFIFFDISFRKRD